MLVPELQYKFTYYFTGISWLGSELTWVASELKH